MSDNLEKSNRGISGQENLKGLIESLLDKHYIVSYVEDYRDGYKGYDEKQFFFQYLIEFPSHECWLLHSTTSIRSDRMNIQQWNAEHLKRLNGHIKKAFVVYPNGLSEKEEKNAKSYQRKLAEARAYTAVDGVVCQSEMYARVEKYALELMGHSGKASSVKGVNFEKWIVEIINNKDNFSKWKNQNDIQTGYMYDIFIKFVDYMNLDRYQVVGINATNDIPKLPTGGQPKTDVLVSVDSYECESIFTYSCKKTSKDWVSAHEYSADQFIEVLDVQDNELAQAIIEFQKCGSVDKLSPTTVEILGRRLAAYNDKINRWVLGGEGGSGDPVTQWAKSVVTYNETTSAVTVMSIEDYLEEQRRKGSTGNFGTMFKWTYPSGGLGKKIQLKMRVE